MSNDRPTQTARPWASQRINPMAILEQWKVTAPWITFDPSIVKGSSEGPTLRRGKQSRHDGTSTFTHETLALALLPLLNRTVFDTRDPPENHPGQSIRYVVGWVHLCTVFPPEGVDIPAGRYPGQRERAAFSYQVKWQ
jgi:hypothetical protein